MVEDRFKYFRIEARELLDALAKGVLELEATSAPQAVVARLLRHAHTLKGAARIVKLPAASEHAHQLEELLEPYRANAGAIPRQQIDALLAELDAIAAELARIESPEAATAGVPAVAGAEQAFDTVRIDVAELDGVLESVAEASAHVAALREQLDTLERAGRALSLLREQLAPGHRERALLAIARGYPLLEELAQALGSSRRASSGRLEQLEVELAQVRDAATRLRLHPVSTLFGPLERAARDAARAQNKQLAFKPSGGEIRVDAPVLAGLRDALLHVIRNAVAHGIESEGERRRAGKPPLGSIELSVERRGNRALFRCSDDGRGIDLDALREVAVERGLLGANQAASAGASELHALLLRGRLSTTRRVSELSGRGIGLDAVREIAQRANGTVEIASQPGRGTTIEIAVPISLASLPVLAVEAAGTAAVLPLDAVRETFRLKEGELTRTADGDTIARDGRLLPFRPLAELLDANHPRARAGSWFVVVVAAAGVLLALGVDRLQGAGTSVVEPLPAWLELDPIVAGAAFDATGSPQLVLDPGGLVARAQALRPASIPPPPPAPLPVLIIDDSLTTRMLEQSILESAGYRVELAASAEEALNKAASARYGLFLVDVEMPGMSGFEFVAHTRQDPKLREVPAILVSSRAEPEDLARGAAAGAHAYMVKGEFDQNRLLSSIRELIG